MKELERIEKFEDSEELAEELCNLAEFTANEVSKYYLRECATQIRGMYLLLNDIKDKLEGEKS